MNGFRARCAALVLLLAAPAACVQAGGGDLDLPKYSIDAGGGRSSGGGFVLEGSIGQPDASAGGLVGGTFHLDGGFWPDAPPPPKPDAVFGDGFEVP